MRKPLLIAIIAALLSTSGAMAKAPTLVTQALMSFPDPMIKVESPVKPLNAGTVLSAKNDGLTGPVKSMTTEDYFRDYYGKVGDTAHNRYTTVYDRSGRTTQSYSDDNTPSVYHYNKYGKFTHRTFNGKDKAKRDKKGRIIEDFNIWKYDSKGRVSQFRPREDSLLNLHWYSYAYDKKGRITKYVYTSVDDNEHFTFADQVTRYKYTGNTINILVDHEVKNKYHLTLDSKGRVCKIVGLDWRDPTTPVTQVIYYDNKTNRPIKTTVSGGNAKGTATLTYDSHGNWVERKIGANFDLQASTTATVNYKYDTHGNWTEKDDGGSKVTRRQITYYK